jgi:hypothetical protein
LGTTGYLMRRQNSIEAIALVSAGGCDVNLDSEHPIDLAGFSCLRDMSWTSLWSTEDFDALRNARKNNAMHLARIQPEFILIGRRGLGRGRFHLFLRWRDSQSASLGKVEAMFQLKRSLTAVSREMLRELAHGLEFKETVVARETS